MSALLALPGRAWSVLHRRWRLAHRSPRPIRLVGLAAENARLDAAAVRSVRASALPASGRLVAGVGRFPLASR